MVLERTVNGNPGLVAQLDGVTVAVYAFDIAGEKIKHIWAVLNPTSSGPGRRADALPPRWMASHVGIPGARCRG
jgi:hypothetical protein